jgi:LmbE family N-acetylglucosaminyl deacetylase
MDRLSLLAVFAHPDDESFAFGGSLAKYAAEGVRTGLVTATAGQAGRSPGAYPIAPEELGLIRVEELRCACRVLGVGSLHLLGYKDNHLSEADPEVVEHAIVNVIRAVRPLVVVTFGPEGSGSGHPDHRAISQLATAAFFAAGDEAKYPGQPDAGLAPFRGRKLYYLTSPLDTAGQAQGASFSPVTTVIDVADRVDAKLAAFRCHRTQMDDYPRLMERLAQYGPREFFFLAATQDLPSIRQDVLGPPYEDDLFAGLR